MHVENRALKNSNRGDRIDALPKKVTGIEVATHARSRDRAQPQQRLRTIDDEPRMHLNSDLHPMVCGELRMLAPVRRNHLLPLPGENLQIVRRPWTRNP